MSLLPACSVYTIRGLHSLGLLMANAFQNIVHAAQSSPLIALELNRPAAQVCQHASLPAPVEEKTAAGISISSPFVGPVWSTYCTSHSGGLPKSGNHLHSAAVSCLSLLIYPAAFFSIMCFGSAFYLGKGALCATGLFPAGRFRASSVRCIPRQSA